METSLWRRILPTLAAYVDRRQEAARNRLPKHLRPLPQWPIVLQLGLNATVLGISITLFIHRDDYVTEAGPALGLIFCFLMMFYTLPTAIRYRRRYQSIRGQRLSLVNVWLMGVALASLPVSLSAFLR